MSKVRELLFRNLCSLQSIKHPKLTTLIYHQVLPKPDPLRPWEIDRIRFEQHLRWISGSYKIIPLSEAVRRLRNNTLEKGCACITFDDGYMNNATVAVNVLKQFNFPATFFCTSAYLDGGMMWNDKVIEAIRVWPDAMLDLEQLNVIRLPVASIEEKLSATHTILNKLKYVEFEARANIADELIKRARATPEQLMMSAAEILRIKQDGMEIGGHTHDHPILLKLSTDQAQQQIFHNKRILEDIIDEPLSLFAYPNGKPGVDYNRDHIQMIKNAGYQAAMSTKHGTAHYSSDLFQLPRFTPWDKSPFRFLSRIALNYYT